MAELRLDPMTHQWVVTGKLPIMPDVTNRDVPCPFCPGNEDLTPKAIEQIPGPDGKWMVRVFHDRAPAFRVEGNLDRRGEGMFDRMNALGAHEVVVDTPQHGPTLAQLEPNQIEKVLGVCRDRILDLKHDIRFRYVSLVRDQGLSVASGTPCGSRTSIQSGMPRVEMGALENVLVMLEDGES